MSRIEERADPPFVLAVARQTLDFHALGGTCQACTPDDCPQTAWALAEIAAHHAARARTNDRPHQLAGGLRRTA